MKGHMLNLISEARHAFSTLTSAADKLALRRIESIERTSGIVGEAIDFERIGLAKRAGMSALDKLENMIDAKEPGHVEETDVVFDSDKKLVKSVQCPPGEGITATTQWIDGTEGSQILRIRRMRR